ncbi:MAG: hypothetical protein BWY20_02456 [Spirochaetes bacterium ADurb.Bin215]|nr:MAG: hypothetical protein BWY20_02456 [Spirochaetes bacterium ADurb.Bin215]
MYIYGSHDIGNRHVNPIGLFGVGIFCYSVRVPFKFRRQGSAGFKGRAGRVGNPEAQDFKSVISVRLIGITDAVHGLLHPGPYFGISTGLLPNFNGGNRAVIILDGTNDVLRHLER